MGFIQLSTEAGDLCGDFDITNLRGREVLLALLREMRELDWLVPALSTRARAGRASDGHDHPLATHIRHPIEL